ncbi:MAG: replication protein C, partial [Rhizobiales bacterium]|nr:replication protein C [Hyphomicrobiales bacterium]
VTSDPPAAVLGPFPADGSIHYGWGELVRRHIPDTPDVDLVANAFRRRLKETGQRLDAGNVEEHFVNFCKKWAASGRKN